MCFILKMLGLDGNENETMSVSTYFTKACTCHLSKTKDTKKITPSVPSPF